MDHKVSKDMISSGMTPSGEKTQADLGRTQYGSAPSPSRLMDAYHSMYQTQKEETLEEHHQKDKNGNTIPHEDEELNEGKIPAGLQAYLDKKKGKKEDKKDMKEQYDLVYEHFIGEGFSEEETYERMSNLTEEQLDEFMKALATRAAQYGANIGKKGSVTGFLNRNPNKQSITPKTQGPIRPTGQKGVRDPEPGDTGFKPSPSQVLQDIKMRRKKQSTIDPKTKIVTNKGEVMQDEYQYIDEYAAALAKGAALLSKAAKPVMKIAKKVAKSDTVKNIATQTAIGSAMSGGNQKKQTTGTVSASADLFDIVKGKLIDEGLNEKEIKNIMLTLTPDEILNEISVGKMADYISAADKDVQKTASNIQKGNGVMGDDPRVKKMTQRAKGMAMAGNKIAKKLTPPSMP